MKNELKARKVREVEDSNDLAHPGDLCVRSLRIYNSSSVNVAVVMKCPYCGMDMASTPVHVIRYSRLSKFLNRLHVPFFGISVRPQLACPYNVLNHQFLITRGRITAMKHK